MNTRGTYIQLGDGFEFIMNRPYEQINHMLKLCSNQVYDLETQKWKKYRATMYRAEDGLHSKFHADENQRPKNFETAPVLTYPDLVKAGYMVDDGPHGGEVGRFRFDYIEYQRRRRDVKIIFDTVLTEEIDKVKTSEQSIVLYINQLRELLPLLRAGEIDAIEFGEEGRPLGFMSHHRLSYISTAGGFQFCIKEVSRGMLGSGHYIGQPDDRTIEIEMQKKLAHYLRPTVFGDKIKEMRANNPNMPKRPELKYFPVL